MLTSKQRAYLKSLANQEDTILMVGKNGVNEQVIKQADEALAAREIIKGKVLETSSSDVSSVAREISESIHGELVQVIGRKFVMYRKNNKEPQIILPKAKIQNG